MRSLSVLFTNNTLAQRRGTELWVRDVSAELVARGHRPVGFSLVLGDVANDLRVATVPVVNRLDDLAFVPDLIHGHHHLETLMAALHFPGVPIVHVCHGFWPWEEMPLQHPAIVRYIAVDELSEERLITNGIAADRVDRLSNFVDVRRFASRAPLPARPKRALVFSNQAHTTGYVDVIREACRRHDISLDIVGADSGRVTDRPEELLLDVDLVFAKGRSALEAMAVGAAVIVADVFGAGPLATTREFDRMRALNFGIRLLRERHTAEWYLSQIAAYDPDDAGRVSARVRQEANLTQAVDRLLEIYDRALSAGSNLKSGPRADLDAQRAAGRHLAAITAHVKQFGELTVTNARLQLDLTAARAANARLELDLTAARAADARLELDLTTARAADAQLELDLAAARAANARLEAELAAARRVNDAREIELMAAQPTLRLRNAVVRLPLVGALAQRTARWLSRTFTS